MHVRFLITDYDNCTFSISSKRADSLSQPIIDMALTGKYDGFYACTHRGYNLVDGFQYITIGTRVLGYDAAAFNRNFPTYKITENFSAATQLPNMAVSTIDDVVYNQCGMAYEKVLKPFELNKHQPPLEAKFLSRFAIPLQLRSKNHQLTQIARHAAEKYPDSEIVLDYVDDIRLLCTQAVAATTGKDWPKNVYLNTYHYANDKVVPVHEPERFFDPFDEVPEAWLKNDEPLHETCSALQLNSIFGKPPSRENEQRVEIRPSSP